MAGRLAMKDRRRVKQVLGTIVKGFGLALVLAGSLGAQEETQEKTQEKGQKEALELQGGTPIAWYGPKPDGAKLLSSIAAARVDMDVGGDLAEVMKQLMEFSLQAAA